MLNFNIMARTWILAGCIVAVPAVALPALTGCHTPHPEEPLVTARMDALISAMRHGDYQQIWAISDAQSRAALRALVSKAQRALDAVDTVYAESDLPTRAAARRALGAQVFGDLDASSPQMGTSLLKRVLGVDKLRFDQHAMDGVDARDVTVDTYEGAPRAVVHTSGGESFVFVKSEGAWFSTFVRDEILAHHSLRAFAANADKVLAAIERQRDHWRKSRDPTTPQGAYNLVRQALSKSPIDANALFDLLDATARKQVLAALTASRQTQKTVQKRTTKKQRRAAYKTRGIEIFIKARSDRELYKAFVRSPLYEPPVPSVAAPDAIEGSADTGDVTVVTADKERIRMLRDDSGYWHVAGHASDLERLLLVKAMGVSDAR